MSQHSEQINSTAPLVPPRPTHLEFVHPALVTADSQRVDSDSSLLHPLSLLLLRADDLAEVSHPDIDSDFALNALAGWRDEARELISAASSAASSASAVAVGSSALQHFDRLIRLHQQHQQATLVAAACHRKTCDEAATTTKQH